MSLADTVPILARVPDEILSRVAAGEYERIGMLVRDAASKKIVAHLQETGVTQSIVGQVLSAVGSVVPDPVSSLTGIGTLIQNEQIKKRLGVIETMMGGMQAMQTATLITSVAGIGVTAASTAMILSRLSRIDRSLEQIEAKFEESTAKREDWDLHRTLRRVEGHLQRLDEARLVRNPETEVRNSERALHDAFGEIEIGIRHVGRRESIDPDFLTQLFAALSLCGTAQIKGLIWLDEKERAAERARMLFGSYRKIVQDLPEDRLLHRFAGNDTAARNVSLLLSEVRHRMASVPSLAETLIAHEVHGRDYLDRLEAEVDEPLMLMAYAPEQD
ncbi:hypothetical protein QO034_02745 [Sedimentitalea sp. JM2-8]|uniref:Uncharacterized protein n=1 Tax=Sedimentitalea xiamensis TaxID=3050037 RepID=A0ABT7FA85_9RHOB|nr:hypothetical protein [Sedimentitalea xiamensis]MDK3072015.1 hypothetical protein [Sedimentitalea xiamensis]